MVKHTAAVVAGLALLAGSLRAQGCSLPAQPYFEFQVEVPARYLSDSVVSPVPRAEHGVPTRELAALVQFVVDTAGVPDLRSYKILTATDPLLAAAGREVLARWRFAPARLGRCAVPQLVQTPLSR